MDRNDLLRAISNCKTELQPKLADYKKITDGATDKDGKVRAFTAEEWAKHEGLAGEINNLNNQLQAHTSALRALDLSNAADDKTASDLGLSGREKLVQASEEHYERFQNFIRLGATDEARNIAFKDYSNLSTVAPSTGGVIIPTKLETQIFTEAFALSALLDLADVSFTSSVKEQVPFIGAIGLAAPRKEMEAYMVSDPALSLKSIDMFNFGFLFPVSQELMADAEGLDAAFSTVAGDCYAQTIEEYGLKGTGGNTAFVDQAGNAATVTLAGRVGPGILQANSTVLPIVTAATATGVDAADIIKLKQAVHASVRDGGTYLISSDFESKALLLKDTTGRPLWMPNLIVGQPSTLNGSPYRVSGRMDAVAASKTPAIFGNFKRGYQIKIRKGLTMARSEHFYFGNGAIAIKGDFRFGSLLKYNAYLARLNTPAS